MEQGQQQAGGKRPQQPLAEKRWPPEQPHASEVEQNRPQQPLAEERWPEQPHALEVEQLQKRPQQLAEKRWPEQPHASEVVKRPQQPLAEELWPEQPHASAEVQPQPPWQLKRQVPDHPRCSRRHARRRLRQMQLQPPVLAQPEVCHGPLPTPSPAVLRSVDGWVAPI